MSGQRTASTNIGTRAAIIRAAALEYTGALAAGAAAGALKNDVSEGLTADQAASARAWKRGAIDAAEYHLRRFAQIANIGVALGVGAGVVTDAVWGAPAHGRSPDEPGPDEPGFDSVARALHEQPAPWPTGGQLGTGGAAMPVVVDGPDSLDRALELLATPAPTAGTTTADAQFDAVRAPAEGATDPATAAVAELLTAVHRTAVVLAEHVFTAPDTDPTAGPAAAAVVVRLLTSALRPLGETLAIAGDLGTGAAPASPAGPDAAMAGDTAGLLLDLADRATALVTTVAPSGLLEAVAALQDLAVRAAPDARELRGRWWTAREGDEPTIRSARNGPYLAVGVRDVVDHLGTPVTEAPSVAALCRCGRSALKPLCDGSHARADFTGDKDPRRIPDRRDQHDGLQVTVLDNRGTCAHSGFCTSRLPVVFRQGKEPFVAASGGRMDEIVRAVRDCPSGALSYEIEQREAREQVDQRRAPGVEVSQDGPYRVAGGIALQDGECADEHRNEGASREHYSLCRCGQSQNKPFCSGMHWYVGFVDPVRSDDEVPTVFEWVGGLPALRRLTRLFYEKYIPEDPLLAPVFAEMSTDHPERVAKWLSEVFGGPKYFTDEFGGYSRMISQHIGKGLTEAQRSRWAALMVQSANDAELPADAEFRAAFVSYVEWGSRIAVENSQTDAAPPPNMPVPQWWWACNATPLARVSALAPAAEEQLVELPDADTTPSFAAHIKPLFRSMDRNSMKFVFDLWAVDDVTTHADAILHRLQEGTMPCDGGWPAEHVEVFRRWVETGTAP